MNRDDYVLMGPLALMRRCEELERDKARLDWLETQWVRVSQPLRYGSSLRFETQPTQHDAEADVDSMLRSAIDRAMTEPLTEGG